MGYRKESLESLLLRTKKPRISDSNLGDADGAEGSPATRKATRSKVSKPEDPCKPTDTPRQFNHLFRHSLLK
jgi:hypothetical protein